MNLSFGLIFGILVTIVTCQRKVRQDYRFKCAAADNKGDFLTFFDKLRFMTSDIQPEIFKYDSVRKITEKTNIVIKKLRELYNEKAYKDLEKYLCDKIHVDLEFLVENFISSQADLYEAFKINKPEEIPDSENNVDFDKMINTVFYNGEKSAKLSGVLAESRCDSKITEAMELLALKDFQKLFQDFKDLPLYQQLTKELRDLRIDNYYDTYMLWFYTTYWERTNDSSGSDSLKSLNHFISLGVSVFLYCQNFFMRLY